MSGGEITKITSREVAQTTELSEDAKSYARASISEHTKRAYKAQWKKWIAWCDERGIDPLASDVGDIANWITDRAKAGQSISTIRTAIAAVRFMLNVNGIALDTTHPKIQKVIAGITREEARAPKQAQAIRADDVMDVIAIGPDVTLIELRDAAVIALGYLFALRRSELVGLDWRRHGDGDGWVMIGKRAIEMTLVRSKTSNGSAQRVAIPLDGNEDAVTIIERWIKAAGIREGEAIVRRVDRWSNVGGRATDQVIARAVKQRVGDHYSGHSLRVGFAVTAAEAGVDLRSIAAVTRHRSMEMPRRYAEQADQLKTSPYNTPGVGLGKKGA